MAVWMPEDEAAVILAYLTKGVAPPPSGPIEFVVFSTPPSPAGSATDGVEAAPAREPVTFGTVTTATGARIMQDVNTNTLSIDGMLVGSDAVEGCGLFDTTKGRLVIVNDSWRPNEAFAAGGSLRIDIGELSVFGTYAPSGS